MNFTYYLFYHSSGFLSIFDQDLTPISHSCSVLLPFVSATPHNNQIININRFVVSTSCCVSILGVCLYIKMLRTLKLFSQIYNSRQSHNALSTSQVKKWIKSKSLNPLIALIAIILSILLTGVVAVGLTDESEKETRFEE